MVAITGIFQVATGKDKKFYLTNLFNNKNNDYLIMIIMNFKFNVNYLSISRYSESVQLRCPLHDANNIKYTANPLSGGSTNCIEI